MNHLWYVWALLAGGVATASSDDWNVPIDKHMAYRFCTFLFFGVGLPIIATIMWHPISDEIWGLRLAGGAWLCIGAFAFGFLIFQFFRWLTNQCIAKKFNGG